MSVSPSLMRGFLKVALEAAEKAGALQLRYLKKGVVVKQKGPFDPVTEADEKSQKLIISTIRKKYPKHDFLAEEAGAPQATSELKWIIDPLDGTMNYSHGYPHFAVSIALEIEGKMSVGVVYDPSRKELFSAVRGDGSRLNGKKIAVSKKNDFTKSMFTTGFAYVTDLAERNIRNHRQFVSRCYSVRRSGSAALDLAYVAAGRLEGYWDLSLSAWDTAAGSLLVEEAGGRMSTIKGQRFHVYQREVVASNGHLHDGMLELICF